MILTHPECLWSVSKLLSIKPKQGTLWCRVINHSSREAQHHLLEHLEFCFAFPWSRFEEHYITDHCREVAIKKKEGKSNCSCHKSKQAQDIFRDARNISTARVLLDISMTSSDSGYQQQQYDESGAGVEILPPCRLLLRSSVRSMLWDLKFAWHFAEIPFEANLHSCPCPQELT